VAAALAAGIQSVYAVPLAALSGSPFTETFGNASAITTGTLNAANLPVTSITSVTRDGTPITGANITYTTGDPTGATVAAGAILINTSTGAFKLGTATTGAGAGLVIVYASHDWNAAFGALEGTAYEYHVYPGPYSAANFGIFNTLVTHATSARKVVAAALPSGDLPSATEVQNRIQAIRNGRLKLLAAFYTGDLTSAFAATTARMPVNGTSKEQPAPLGITYTGSYTRSQFGAEETPATNTLHQLGCNAIFQAPGGAFLISDDRASTALTDFERFHSTRRMIRVVENEFDDDLLAARRSSSTAIPLTPGGLLVIQGILQRALDIQRKAGVIVDGNVSMPDFASISAQDRLNRVVRGIDVTVVLAQQVHLFIINLGVNL